MLIFKKPRIQEKIDKCMGMVLRGFRSFTSTAPPISVEHLFFHMHINYRRIRPCAYYLNPVLGHTKEFAIYFLKVVKWLLPFPVSLITLFCISFIQWSHENSQYFHSINSSNSSKTHPAVEGLLPLGYSKCLRLFFFILLLDVKILRIVF